MPDTIYLENGLTAANVVLVNGDCYEKIGSVEHLPNIFVIDGEFETCDDCVNRGSSSMGSVPPPPPHHSGSSLSSGSSGTGGNTGASSGSAGKQIKGS